MPVMKRLTVDGVNYDTVGEASVTQVQTSGTKIATVTIDGTATDLYAPEGGGGGPEPSSTTPAMDGTAAVGTATTYARADHVHPTDTSRQATLVSGTNIKTINGTSILDSGDLTVGGSTVFYREYGNGNVSTGKLTIDGTDYEIWAYSQPSKATSTPLMDGTAAIGNSDRYAAENHVHPTDTSRQATLVSGTNIKTVNGTSILGSGNISTVELPTVTVSDNGKVLMVVGGVWQVASLPLASDSAFGVVKVGGTTITATDGVISTAGGSGAYEVTITLTNPLGPGHFQDCHIYQCISSDYWPEREEVGVITSPIGSATVTVSMPYLRIEYHGSGVALGTATCTGGVSLATSYDDCIEVYEVTGDGTIVSDGVDYDD